MVTAGFAAGAAQLALIGLGHAQIGHIFATGIASVGVGLLATLISIRRQAPALVTATAGITPMLPGLAVFRSVFYFAVDERFLDGIAQLLSAVAIALAIGSGVVMGELLGSPLRYRAGRVGDFLRIEGPPGLRRAVGRVVRLQPATDVPAPRAQSVALEPETSAEDSDGDEPPKETVDTDDGSPTN